MCEATLTPINPFQEKDEEGHQDGALERHLQRPGPADLMTKALVG